jgi:hypothetical protein
VYDFQIISVNESMNLFFYQGRSGLPGIKGDSGIKGQKGENGVGVKLKKKIDIFLF